MINLKKEAIIVYVLLCVCILCSIYFFPYIIFKESVLESDIKICVNGKPISNSPTLVIKIKNDNGARKSEVTQKENGRYIISETGVTGMNYIKVCVSQELCDERGELIISDFKAQLQYYNGAEHKDVFLKWNLNFIKASGKWEVEHTVESREGSDSEVYEEKKTIDINKKQEIYWGS